MLIGLVVVSLLFGLPIVGVLTEHQRKMYEMKLKLQNHGDAGLRAELDTLRAEVGALRDTSTQYDISFDTALQRLERRVEGVERQSRIPAENNLQQNTYLPK